MPEIELKPDDYKVTDAKGRTFRRDDPRYFVVGLAVCLAVLGLIFWKRDELSSGVLFGGAAVMAACAGIFLGNLLKDVY